MKKSILMLRLLLRVLLCQSVDIFARYDIREGTDEGEFRTHTIIIPYVFSSEILGSGVGIGYAG